MQLKSNMSTQEMFSRVEEVSDQLETPAAAVTKDLQKRTRSCCRFRYRMRRFSSKGAILVAVWTLLINISFGYLDNIQENLVDNKLENYDTVSLVPSVVWLLSALLSGWLADAWFGNYYVTKTGVVLLFIATILECVIYIGMYLVQFNWPDELLVAMITVTNCIGYIGYGSCIVTLLQLGLDQMPDASSANITSYIAWYVFSIFAGLWLVDGLDFVPLACLNHSAFFDYVLIFSLFPVLCMAIVLCSDFLLSPKWLIIEPKTPQTLKNIYLVLKFAKKHKAPVNRSALTYWEEDIPSRIDLGKSRYGGPFTTEQVEDVKTILRILVVCVPMSLSMTSLYLFTFSLVDPYPSNKETFLSDCGFQVILTFTYEWTWLVVVLILLFEFVVYPFVAHRIPSALKRIGAASFLVVLGNSVWLILSIAVYANNITKLNWIGYPHSLLIAIIYLLLLPSTLEFICSQSPYNMKSLLISYVWFINSFSFVIAGVLQGIFADACIEPYCVIIYSVIATLLGVIGFVLHCVLAYWYKRRVRDDISTPQRLVEEVYDRYLSAQPQIDFSGLTDSQ